MWALKQTSVVVFSSYCSLLLAQLLAGGCYFSGRSSGSSTSAAVLGLCPGLKCPEQWRGEDVLLSALCCPSEMCGIRDGWALHMGIRAGTISARFSEAHLVVVAAFLVCAVCWSSAHCLAESCSSVHSPPLQGFLQQPANSVLFQAVLEKLKDLRVLSGPYSP